jgi:prevent-host-death family protein
MAKIVNMHDAKTHLSRLVADVIAGDEVVIAKAGKPVAKLVRYEQRRPRRTPGGWEGRVWMAPDFDAVDEEIARLFEGEDDEA